MLEDYANQPGSSRPSQYPGRRADPQRTELDRLGFQTHTHATGDGGIRLTLDAIEHAAGRTAPPTAGTASCMRVPAPGRPAPVPELGVTAAMQPRHCSPDLVAELMDNVGEDRWGRAWRIRA